MASQNDHEGHRARLRKKFINNGLDMFEPHEALELYLFYAIKQRNTNPLAHRLLKEFGSLSAIFDAPIDTLMSRGKISEPTAVLLKLLPEMARLYLNDNNNNSDKIMTEEKLPQYILNKFIGKQKVENCFLLLMDSKGKELYSSIIAEGSFSKSVIPTRKIVDYAMRYNASIVVLAHNHPSGVAFPSKEDLIATKNLTQLLSTLDIVFFDHFIVSDDDCYSIRKETGAEYFIPNLPVEK